MKKLVDLGPDQSAVLPRIAEEFGETQTSVMRAGLALLQVAIREARRGRGIGIVGDGRVVHEIMGFWNQATPVEPTGSAA